ncbi:hypothetical protein QBC43DRAFT_202164 [Cladorrhinum sp. PSN259]|nr:hypothetical protein QBC43DRAFT_202164 [Cladorrhinum sp. PSN259]
MNNMASMANMNMGAMGPVAGPMMINGGLPPQPGQRLQQQQQPQDQRVLLNTYIYEYFLRYEMWECARAILASSDGQINVKKESPGRNNMGSGLGDDPMDTDSKDALDHKRPEDLPAPNMPGCVPDSCFLYEWFSLFWSMFSHQKGSGPLGQQVSQYVQHTQQQSRLKQQEQREMLRQMRPGDFTQQSHQMHLVKMQQNGIMRGMPNNLQRAAMANNSNPQTMQILQQQKASQMQRDPSNMDGNQARPGSPASADNAPSPSKRPRLEGAPFNQNPAVMMANGRPQGMPGQQQVGTKPDSIRALLLQNGLNPSTLNPDQLQAFASAPHAQAKSLAMYSANLQQHHGNQMPTKPQMANAVGPQGQGSPMVNQNPGGTDIAQFYNQDMAGQGNMRPGGNNGQNSAGSNHALQDYQMQLMLLEQQNKRRLMLARQEQETLPPRDGPGGPGGPPGPNATGFQGASPPGGRNGASPNPTEQMKRNQQQMANAVGIGSPLPDGAAQSRSSPNNMGGFMSQQGMDPHNPQQQFMSMQAAQMNGQVGMRPPSSHPQPFNGQMNPQQQMMARQQAQQQQQQNAQNGGPGMQWQQGAPNGQMAVQAGQPQVQGTPTQTQRSMPPPSAPSAVPAANAVNSRNATSSPQVTTAAPPTPSQGNKAAPKKKADGKKKNAASKKAGANLNTTGSTPVADVESQQEAPTPATPITPVNPTSFGKNNNVNVNAGQIVQNAQPIPPPPQAPAVQAPQHPDQSMFNMGDGIVSPRMAHSTFASAYTHQQDFPLGFADPTSSTDVLNDFDFDSFLHDGNNGEDGVGGFDFGNPGFMDDGGNPIGTAD